MVQLCCLSGRMLWGKGKDWGGSWKAGEEAVKTNSQEAARWGAEVDTSSILYLRISPSLEIKIFADVIKLISLTYWIRLSS